MNKLDNVPVALIRGYDYPRGEGSLAQLMRDPASDLFR
jgi:F420-0:gamma-glutamyl ligase